jgi:hypothetical protein
MTEQTQQPEAPVPSQDAGALAAPTPQSESTGAPAEQQRLHAVLESAADADTAADADAGRATVTAAVDD